MPPAKKKTTTRKTPTRTRTQRAEAPPEAVPEAGDEAPRAGRARARKSLVIVESPAKARTINKYLGRNFVVKASMGHIRDLPKGKFGVDVDGDFEPAYAPIQGKAKVISELRRVAKDAERVYLAPDPDREGEAIAWHLAEELQLDRERVSRVTFNEITKKAILAAFESPNEVDMDKVNAQQARRVLDRIMGYKLSPLLWKKVAKGLSAGRVQSVAVRLIVEREREIRAFVKEEYWRVIAALTVDGQRFQAELKRLGELRIDRNLDRDRAIALIERLGGDARLAPAPDQGRPQEIVLRAGRQALELVELEDKPKTSRPTPPFTTSQLQQKASTMLRFSAKKTMMLAQQLYEGVGEAGGLITYMRTDSTRVSEDALVEVRGLIESRFGRPYLPEAANRFRAKAKGAQEAHEAIRPTDVTRLPESLRGQLSEDQLKLYTLIWNKFVSSQMNPGQATITTAVFVEGDARFVAQGEVEVFDGCTRLFGGTSARPTRPGPTEEGETGAAEGREHQTLPTGLRVGASYVPEELQASQHWTQPPPRYSEATLVKELEKKGIGRPSTYAAIISTIQDRGYVTLESRRFAATELGEIVTDQLVEHFGDVINTDYTSNMELDLDRIEGGAANWVSVVRHFYKDFMADLGRAEKAMKNIKAKPQLSDKTCDKCGAPMAILFNKRGKFLGCSKYPECKNTMPVDGPREKSEVIETDKKCEKCSKPMVIRTGRRGRFMACTGFPKCKNTYSVDEDGNPLKPKETGIQCEKCNSPMVIKGSRRGPFLACSGFPKCRNARPLPEELREKPEETGEVCENCGAPMVKKRSRWGKPFLACSAYPKCKNARDLKPAGVGGEPAAGAEDASGVQEDD